MLNGSGRNKVNSGTNFLSVHLVITFLFIEREKRETIGNLSPAQLSKIVNATYMHPLRQQDKDTVTNQHI